MGSCETRIFPGSHDGAILQGTITHCGGVPHPMLVIPAFLLVDLVELLTLLVTNDLGVELAILLSLHPVGRLNQFDIHFVFLPVHFNLLKEYYHNN